MPTDKSIPRRTAIREVTKATGINSEGGANEKAMKRGSIFLSVLDRWLKDEGYRLYFAQRGWDKKDAEEIDIMCATKNPLTLDGLTQKDLHGKTMPQRRERRRIRYRMRRG